MILLYTEDFSDLSEVTVAHNLNRIDIDIRVVQDGGLVDDQIVDIACFDPSDPRNVVIVKFVSSISGRIQILDIGSTIIYPSVSTPSVTVTLDDAEVEYGSKAKIIPFDSASSLDSKYFELSNGMLKCKKKGIYESSFKVASKFNASNRTKQHSKMRIAKFDSSQNFVEYVKGSTTSAFHRNGTDGIASSICPSMDIQMDAGEQLGVVAWRHSGKADLVTVSDGSSMTVKLTKEL